MKETKQPPVATVSVGHVQGAIWRNVSEGATFYNSTFSHGTARWERTWPSIRSRA